MTMPKNSTPNSRSLLGRRILLVEDEMLVSMMLEDVLGEEGCEIVGPAARLGKAVALASNEPIDAAILDLNVASEEVYPVAEVLTDRRIPFAFVSGYGSSRIPADYRDRPTLQKPFRASALVELVKAMLGQVAS